MDFNYRSNIDDDRLTFRVIRGGLAFAYVILYFAISPVFVVITRAIVYSRNIC